MNYTTFQLLALELGLVAALFLFRGGWVVSSSMIAQLAGPKSEPSDIIDGLAGHVGNTIAGSILLGLCFALQGLALYMSQTEKLRIDGTNVVISLGACVVVTFCVFLFKSARASMLRERAATINRQKYDRRSKYRG